MRPYADTNLFVRFYLPIAQTAESQALTNEAGQRGVGRLPITWLLEIELTNAIEHSVFTSRTTGQSRISPEAAAAAHAFFAEDIEQAGFLVRVGLEADSLRRTARELSLRHTARHGSRTYDLLHVASALLLGCDTFWSFDTKARALAQAEGLAVNPMPSS
jgi:predicted nucleic acid-binding protein